jgi:uncharacterized integral membrane protein (TIGR00697 family)
MFTTTLSIIVLISLFTIFGSLYARKYQKPDAIIALYVIFIALSQILAAKIAVFDLGFAEVTAPAAVLIFAVTFLITDIVNERFGRKETHRMIFIAFITQVVMIAFIYIGTYLQPAPFWQNQSAWELIFGLVPRITLASWAAFLVSENLDAYLFASIKRLTRGNYLWLRNVGSSIISLSVDTLLFVTLAFYGTGLLLWPLMVGQFLTKYLVAIIDIPFMYLNRWIMYR